jgi:hypothetical protein
MTIEALVTRKTQDLARIAAEDLLRAQDPDLIRVERAELWTFEVDGSGGEREVRSVLEDSTLIVNPNVHRSTMENWRRAPVEGARLCITVTDRVDARAASVLRAARERRGLRSIRGVRRSVVWILEMKDRAGALRLGQVIAGPQGGVLANVHAQDVNMEVWEAA